MSTLGEQPIELTAEIVDAALERALHGEPADAIVADYPEYAAALRPLIETATRFHTVAKQPLPAELEDWLVDGRRAFGAAVAQAAIQAQTPIEDALDLAVQQLRAGSTPDNILAEMPEHAEALAPLLRTVTQLQIAAAAPLPASLQSWLPEGRRSFNAAVAQHRPHSRRALGLGRVFAWPRLIAVVIVAALLIGTVDQASAQSLPGETLYSWKRTRESITLTLTNNHAGRSALHIEYSQRRLKEIDALLSDNRPADQQLLSLTVADLLAHAQSAANEARMADDLGLLVTVSQQLSQIQHELEQTANRTPVRSSSLDQASTAIGELAATPTTDPLPVRPVTPTPAATGTPTPTATSESGAILSPTAREAPTETASATPTNTSAPAESTRTRQPEATPTATVMPTEASTSTPTPTETVEITPTSSPTNTPRPAPAEPTDTPVPTATPVAATERPTEPPPPTPLPTRRPPRQTATPTSSPTATETATPTSEPTATSTATPTSEPTPTETATPTSEPTVTDSATPTATGTGLLNP